MTADRITILRCERARRATKRWFLDPYTGKPKLEGYDAGKWFAAESVQLYGIGDLSALLTRLERDPRAFAIRGELLPGVNPRRVRRLKHRRGNAGPFFAEPAGGRLWVLIDFDKVPIPAHIDLVDDPEGAVEYLVGLLPDEFRDVSYHWQLSSSAGMGDVGVLSAHLWFWLDRPVTDGELRRWASTIEVPLDRSLFNEVQPHYTAAPIFEAGLRDPLPRRSGLRIGIEDAVQLVVPDPAPCHVPAGSTGAGEGLRAAAGFEAKLALLGDGEGLIGFHGPLRNAAASYIATYGDDGTDRQALKGLLRKAIDAAPKRSCRGPDIERYSSDEYLDEIIDSAIEKFGNAGEGGARGGAGCAGLWYAGRPIEGTIGERHLRDRYGITRASWPASVVRLIEAPDLIRIAPDQSRGSQPALMFAATDASGAIAGLEIVSLDAESNDALLGEAGRQPWTVRGNKPVRWPGEGEPAPLLLARDSVTAASVWHATGFESWGTLGSPDGRLLDNVPLSRRIIVCADDDPRNAPSNLPRDRAIGRWRREGRRVLLVKPWRLSRGDKSDFNNLLLVDGVEAVRERILAALEALEASAVPLHQSLELARERCATAINSAIDELLGRQPLAPPAPFKVAMIAVGIGKTEAAVRRIVSVVVRGGRITYLVPTHKLGGELVDRIKAEARHWGVEVAVDVWRGRAAERPDAPGQPMCGELEVVGDAQAAKFNVAKTVCVACPRAAECPYLAQGRRSADIWIGAHELLFHEMPAPMRGSDLVVIDEGFALRAGIVGTSGMPILLTIDEIKTIPSMRMTPSQRTRKRPPRRDKDGREFRRPGAGAAADVVAELMPLRHKLAAALADHPDGGLDRQRLLDAGLTAGAAERAAAIEWRTLDRDALLGRVLPWEGFRAAIRQAAIIAHGIDRRLMVWQAVEDLLSDAGAAKSGRAVWGEQEADGVTFRALRLFGLEPIAGGWFSTPTLHIDGTVNMPLLWTRVPHAALIATIEANAPAMSVRQIVGKTFGKGALAEEKTLARVWDWAVAYASRRGGDWLVILPKAAESEVTASAAPPTFIKTAHFGNLRGLDQHRHVAGLIVIGRPMPPPADVERIAGILTGREIAQRVEGWYPTEAVHLVGRDGTAATVEADRHPDGIAEAVRSAICQDELLQAVGRARGVNRTAANPVEVILLGNVPVPGLVPDTIEQWQAPNVDDQILARHGAVLEAAAHAAKVAGLTTKAVERRRASLPPFSYEYYLYETGGNLRQALYQLTGPGRRRQRVVYDPRRITDIAGWLTGKLGPLAYLEAIDQPAQAEAETASSADVSEPAPEPIVESELPEAAVFRSGIVPPELRARSRERRRAAGVSQEEVARRIGISRPQLANAEAGRFGLSTEAAARFLATIVGLPERQASLRF